jgi:hypothetical protein
MKKPIVLLYGLLAIQFAGAQESVPLEAAQNAARVATKALGVLTDAPFKMDLDLEKPSALSGAALAIPAAKLSAELFARSSQEIIPLGQLWTLRITLAQNGKVTPNSKLRLVTVMNDGDEVKVQLYFLGARKNEKGEWTLVVYAKDKEPLLTAALQKAEGSQQQPIELEARKEGEDSGTLTVRILGRYKAELPLMKQEN